MRFLAKNTPAHIPKRGTRISGGTYHLNLRSLLGTLKRRSTTIRFALARADRISFGCMFLFVQVVFEVALGLVIIVLGSLWSAPKLRPVKGGYDTLNK